MSRPRIIWGIVALILVSVAVIQFWPEGSPWRFGLAGLCGLLALGWTYYLMTGLSVLAVFMRAFLATLPVGFVAVGVIWGVLQIEGTDQDVIRAIIAAVVVAAGWVVGFVSTEWRRVGQDQEKRRDMVKAALTEIELIVHHVQKQDWDALIEETRAAFFNDSRYHVFIYYGHQFGTTRRLIEQIEILDAGQIRSVMDFFQLLDRLERMEARIASDEFIKLPVARREAGIVRYLKMQRAIPKVGERAADALRIERFQGWLRHVK
jgi:hypothetical protein